MPDPITKAAFFTESKSPPEPSCAPRRRGGEKKRDIYAGDSVQYQDIKLLFPLYIWLDYKKQHHELGRHVARYCFASVGKTWAEHKTQHESFCVVVQNQIKEILCCGYIKCRCESTKQWSDHLYRWFSLLVKLVSPYKQAFQVMAEDKRARFLFCFFLFNTRDKGCLFYWAWGALHMRCPCMCSVPAVTVHMSQISEQQWRLHPPLIKKHTPQRSSCLTPG